MDCNDLTETGIYYPNNSSTNLPTSGKGGMLITKRANNAVCIQLFVKNNNEASETLYTRHTTAVDTWTSWMQLV